MSQGMRALLANRKFAIPLIALLALCLIGVLMIGIVIVAQPGQAGELVAKAEVPLDIGVGAVSAVPGEALEPTAMPSPVASPTPRPTATWVPVRTASNQTLPMAAATATVAVVAQAQPLTSNPATSARLLAQASDDPSAGDSELAETGVGWGLVMASGIGLAMVVLFARRMRLAS